MIHLKYIKLFFYFLISISFIYLIFNLNPAISSLSNVLINFFKSLFPYLFIFLIINQLLIKTNLIYIFGYLLQFICFPLFKLNAKTCSLLLISLLNGYPSSVIYSKIMLNDNKINKSSATTIAKYLFLPSYTFVFFLIKENLSNIYFTYFIISLYLPIILILLVLSKQSSDSYVSLKEVKKELENSFSNFNLITDLKTIFLNSILTLINILGMISFYSLITLFIPNLLFKGIFEFSMPSLLIISNNYHDKIKTLFLLIILTFSSFSSISQASLYLDDLTITTTSFLKSRIICLLLSISIYSLFFIF